MICFHLQEFARVCRSLQEFAGVCKLGFLASRFLINENFRKRSDSLCFSLMQIGTYSILYIPVSIPVHTIFRILQAEGRGGREKEFQGISFLELLRFAKDLLSWTPFCLLLTFRPELWKKMMQQNHSDPSSRTNLPQRPLRDVDTCLIALCSLRY